MEGVYSLILIGLNTLTRMYVPYFYPVPLPAKYELQEDTPPQASAP